MYIYVHTYIYIFQFETAISTLLLEGYRKVIDIMACLFSLCQFFITLWAYIFYEMSLSLFFGGDVNILFFKRILYLLHITCFDLV